MTVMLTGDWALAKKILSQAPARVRKAYKQTLLREAHALRAEMIRGITKQAPGGVPFLPLSEVTLAIRKLRGFKGTKALIHRGDLRNAINVILRGDEAFIGVPRKARAKGRKSLIDVARIHEYGAGPFIVPKTRKMLRFLFAALNKAGIRPKGRGSKSTVFVMDIPARPFIRPVFDKYRKEHGKKFLEKLAQNLNFTG